MNRFRRHRRLALIPAVVWLLVQFVMTGALTAPAQAAVDLAAAELAAHSLCLADGDVAVPPDQPDPGPAGKIGHPGCEWCQAFGSAPELVPPADGIPLRLSSQALKFRIHAAAMVARLGAPAGFDSRAPPL